jgi:hypothetical protein
MFVGTGLEGADDAEALMLAIGGVVEVLGTEEVETMEELPVGTVGSQEI